MTVDIELTEQQERAIARAKRRLLDPLRSEAHGRSEWDYDHTARLALDVITTALAEEADADLAIFRALAMPAWAGPSAAWPVVAEGPLLDLLEEATTS